MCEGWGPTLSAGGGRVGMASLSDADFRVRARVSSSKACRVKITHANAPTTNNAPRANAARQWISEAISPDNVGLTALPPIAENSKRLLARPWAVGGVDSMMTVSPANVVMLTPSPTTTRALTNQ